MPLESQIFTIPLGQGVDTKKDPKTLGASFSALKNGVLKKTNRLSKRCGFNSLTNLVPGGRALAVFKDELLQLISSRLYSYSPTQDYWLDRGRCYSVSVETRKLVQLRQVTGFADASVIGNTIMSLYLDPGGARCRLEDVTTGALLNDEIVLPRLPIMFRVINFKNKFVILYSSTSGGTTNLYGIKIDPTTGLTTSVTIALDVATTGQIDAINFNDDKIAFIYGRTADVKIGWLDEFFVVQTGSFAAVTIATTSLVRVACALTTGSTLTCAFVDNGNLRAIVYTAAFTVSVALSSVDATVDASTRSIAIGSNSERIDFYHDRSSGTKYIKRVSLTISGSSYSATSFFMRKASLASKCFTRDDQIFMAIFYESSLQSTMFIVDRDSYVVSKHQPGTTSNAFFLPSATSIGDSFYIPLIYKSRLVSTDGKLFSQLGLAITSITFEDNSNFSAVEIGDNLHIVGGYLSMYDGVSVVEHGFHLFPEDLTSGLSGAAGVPIGTYLYTAIYEWIDGKGNIHRSAPAVPIQVVVTGTAQNVTIQVPTIHVTSKRDRSKVSLVLFRTASNQTNVFYRQSSVTSPVYNDFTVDTIAFVDTLTDAALFSNEILYTSGGVLENIAPQACKYICLYKNRIILAGLEDNTVAYSKTWTPGGPVEFVQDFAMGVDKESGDVTSIDFLDDKLIMFKRDRFYYTYGEGPNDLGTGSYFPTPQAMTADVGCIDQQSIVRTPDGIIFKSEKGFYILPPNMTPSYIGAPVEDWNVLSTTSATLHSDLNQVRFTHSDGVCLVYDYFFRQWSTFDNYEAYDSLIWKKTYVLLRTSGEISRENLAVFRDSGDAIRIYLETGWIALGDISGFQRVKRILLLADYLSSHKLVISIGYDFESTYDSSIVFDASLDLDPTKYGETILGSLSLENGNGITYRLEAHLSRQKCQSIRFRIEELTDSGDPGSGEGLSFTTLGLLFGLKRGLAKTPNKFGAS